MGNGPYIGQRVTLVSLLSDKEFTGRITELPSSGLCRVKIEGRMEPVGSVKFYEEKPAIVDTMLWQICFPVE